tara:strand:- start:291 stop:632 length:342 start_codon:yes stop_codon:yes gene_type:complete
MRLFLLVLFLIIQPPKVEILKKIQYQDLVRKGYTIIDVRTPEEFLEEHIEGAQNINVKSEAFVTEIENLSKSDTLLIYCRTGRRSIYAAQVMVSFGFQKIYDLDGGFLNWKNE